MREILFRGKRVDNGKWVVGYFFNLNDRESDLPKTVGQYTGLTDKNGKKIFEGDIIVITDAYGNKVTYTVEYKPTAFCVSQLGVNYSTYLGDFNNGKYEIEIIGNIYDNPELLELT